MAVKRQMNGRAKFVRVLGVRQLRRLFGFSCIGTESKAVPILGVRKQRRLFGFSCIGTVVPGAFKGASADFVSRIGLVASLAAAAQKLYSELSAVSCSELCTEPCSQQQTKIVRMTFLNSFPISSDTMIQKCILLFVVYTSSQGVNPGK